MDEELNSSNIGISRMREEDVAQVVALEQESGLSSRGAGNYRISLTEPKEILLIAGINKEIIGIFSAIVVVDELLIDNVAVAAPWRGLGVASRLMLEGLQAARRRGAVKAVLDVRSNNLIARSLYEKHGFVVAGRRPEYYHNPLDDALIMTREINS